MQNDDMASFKVILTGFPKPDVSPGEAARRFHQLFNITLEQARSFLEGRPNVIKNYLSAEQADKYLQALTHTGVGFDVVKETPELSPDQNPESDTATDQQIDLLISPLAELPSASSKSSDDIQGQDSPPLAREEDHGGSSLFGVVPKSDSKAQEEWKRSANNWRQYVAEKHSRSRFNKLVLGVILLGAAVSVWPLLKSFFANPAINRMARQQTEQRLAYLLTVMGQIKEAHCELPSILEYIKTHPHSFQPVVLSLASEGKLFQDGWGRLIYCSDQGEGKFSIRSTGPDGVINTADDITQEDLLARAEQFTAQSQDTVQTQVAGYVSIKHLEQIVSEFSEREGSIPNTADLFVPRLKPAETALTTITDALPSITDANVKMRYRKCQDQLQYYLAILAQGNEAQEKINTVDRQVQEMEETYEKTTKEINLAAEKLNPVSDMAKLISDAKSQMVSTHSAAKKDLEGLRSAASHKLPSMSNLLQYEEEISKCYR